MHALKFAPEELGIDAQDLKWILARINQLAIEHVRNGGEPDNASLIKLWGKTFEPLVLSDKKFRDIIPALASIQLIQIQMANSAPTLDDSHMVKEMLRELDAHIESVLKERKEKEDKKVLDKNSEQG